MKIMKRPILTLKKDRSLVDPERDRPLELGVYDVLLPCRKFTVSHKVAEVGRVSLTAEFLLRLLKSVDGMKEEDAMAFFGYDLREMSFVITEVETNDFVIRRNGRLFLTTVGHGLFQDSSGHPEIFEVVSGRPEIIGFDLISLAPEDCKGLAPFARRLPELHAIDTKKMSEATWQIPSAFRRFYGEIVNRRDPAAMVKRSLYSIDNVEAKDRFLSTVCISLQSTGLCPSVAEPDMSEWRPEYEREDRADIIEAASRFVADLKVHRRPDDCDAYQVLLDLAPNFLKDFVRRDGLAVQRYYREAFTRAGDIRSDRSTVPLLGSLFTRENTRRLFEVAGYGLRLASKRPPMCVWLIPQVPHWGATIALPEILDQIKSRLLASQEDNNGGRDERTIGLIGGRAPKHIEIAFNIIGTSNTPRIPPSLEMLLVPNVLAALIVHAPIGLQNGIPVPLGFASFNREIVACAQHYMIDQIAGYAIPHRALGDIQSILSMKTANQGAPGPE